MKLSEELIWRGFVSENTFDDPAELDARKRKFYLGADPSANSLQIGNLAALMMCKVFIRHGYTPFLLVGGATGQIGDPKDNEERELKSSEEIDRNKAAIYAQMKQIAGDKVTMVDNLDWFSGIKFLDFLREIGKQFSMTQLLDREFVKARIGGVGISYAEFSYSLIQGYDFLHLYRKYGIDLQVCGADQFGNCVSGLHLIKRLEGARADVWASPLILDKTTGRKFGKSESGTIWLSPEKTSVYSFYQFWLNVDDAGVEDYLKVYTELDRDAIDDVMRRQRDNPAERAAQKTLAREVTNIVHGVAATDTVIHVTNVLFGAADVRDLEPDGLDVLATEIPTAPRGESVVRTMVSAGIASSNGEALRLIRGNAVSVNGVKIADDTEISEISLVKVGKNKFVLVR